ncbi:MAG: hypothetical protein VB016_02670 [Methanomassiliicoccaceae archaeon]|nr:hypothetical protein [Methanomassiliicoccaceae archaeon]
MAQNDYRRPILLSLFAILEILGGIITAAIGAFFILGGAISLPFALPAGITLVVAGGITIVAGLIMIMIGVAMFSGKKWGWWFAVIMTALALIFSLISFNIVSVIIEAIVLLYLNMKNTKGWFEI